MPKKVLEVFFILAFFTFFPTIIFNPITLVSASSERWVQKYEVNVPLYNDSFVQTSDGGYAIAGRTGSGALLLKTDSYGNVEWNQTYLGDGARSIIETSDGGYALAGGTQLIKTDVYGNIEWDRTLLGGNRVNSLIQTSDGGYVATGFSGDSQQGEENYFWLVKTDRLGYNMWNKTYETVMTGRAASVIQTIDGGFAMLGINSFNPDFLLVKTDSSGELEWSKKYEKPDYDSGQCIVQNSDGGYTLAGMLWNSSDQDNMAGLIKTDSNGNMLWMKNYLGSWHVSMVATSDGGYVLCSDLMLTKTDSEGNMQWTRDLNLLIESPIYNGISVIQTLDGGYAILNTGPSLSSVWIIKTDFQGIPEFPSWTILPLLLAATLAAIIYRKKLHRKPN